MLAAIGEYDASTENLNERKVADFDQEDVSLINIMSLNLH